MTKWLQIILQSLISSIRSWRDLAFEILLLRQQLAANETSPTAAEIVKGRPDTLGSVFEVLANLARCLTHCHA